MKSITLKSITSAVALAALVLSLPAAFAEDVHHPEKAGKSASAGAASGAEADISMGPMRERMEKMRSQMQAIRQAKNPKEREKLLQEHMQSMREGMKMMRGMRGGEMRGGAAGGGGMMGGGMMGGPMDNDGMQRRMEMMEEMMEQMIEHQEQTTKEK